MPVQYLVLQEQIQRVLAGGRLTAAEIEKGELDAIEWHEKDWPREKLELEAKVKVSLHVYNYECDQ